MSVTRKIALLLALALVGSAFADSALAHGRRSFARVGVFIGVPIGWPYWYGHPFYYPPVPSQIVVVPSQPQTYIQREGATEAPESPAFWYYCADARAYYPYVKECPGGWQRVPPRPPG